MSRIKEPPVDRGIVKCVLSDALNNLTEYGSDSYVINEALCSQLSGYGQRAVVAAWDHVCATIKSDGLGRWCSEHSLEDQKRALASALRSVMRVSP
jgi:hypothetical protein